MNVFLICITKVLDFVFIYDMHKWQHVHTKQQGAKDGAVGDTTVRGATEDEALTMTTENVLFDKLDLISVIPL